MKSIYRIFATVIELLAGLAAIFGCSKHSPEAAKPSEIHWHGVATGYEETTKPADQSSPKP